MDNQLLIFEGYDGAGKTTLIRELVRELKTKTARVIGRKTEERLSSLSEIIESSTQALSKEGEMLTRLALEVERLIMVSECRPRFDYVLMDRGPISLMAWASYYDLKASEYSPVFERLKQNLAGATLFRCRCDFETCWARIVKKTDRSKKDALGKTVNQLWYQKYAAILEAADKDAYRVVDVDTACDPAQSLRAVLNAI